MIGLAQGAFDNAVGYAYQRKQFGKLIGDFQAMGHGFAEAAVKIEAARLLTYNAARLKVRHIALSAWSLADEKGGGPVVHPPSCYGQVVCFRYCTRGFRRRN